MTRPILFSRPDCHLCAFVEEMLTEEGVRWTEVDIDSDPELSERYGIRIPVLRLPDTGAELDWPFDDDELLEFLGREG